MITFNRILTLAYLYRDEERYILNRLSVVNNYEAEIAPSWGMKVLVDIPRAL